MDYSKNSPLFLHNSPSITADILRTIRRRAYEVYLYKAHPIKTVGSYTRHIWQDMRDYFNGDQDAFAFIDSLVAEIDNQYTRAWNEGAKEAGVDPRDMSDPDLVPLQDRIEREREFILGLAEDIDAARAQGMTTQEFSAAFKYRADLWANRYAEVKNEAVIWFSRDKLEWQLGATEQHCATCAKLNGVVAYADEWNESGLRPQSAPNDRLECGGWRCDCSLVPTDKRKTRGGIPQV